MESFFTDIAQQGIAFGLLAVIIIVLARRVLSLEKEKKDLIDERRESERESILIVRDATEVMRDFINFQRQKQ
jgi:membrane protein implicated in regulation of membrane protease activity